MDEWWLMIFGLGFFSQLSQAPSHLKRCASVAIDWLSCNNHPLNHITTTDGAKCTSANANSVPNSHLLKGAKAQVSPKVANALVSRYSWTKDFQICRCSGLLLRDGIISSKHDTGRGGCPLSSFLPSLLSHCRWCHRGRTSQLLIRWVYGLISFASSRLWFDLF